MQPRGDVYRIAQRREHGVTAKADIADNNHSGMDTNAVGDRLDHAANTNTMAAALRAGSHSARQGPTMGAGNIHPLPPPQRTLIDTITIPLWLGSHFGVVRLAGWIYGRDPVNYAAPLFAY